MKWFKFLWPFRPPKQQRTGWHLNFCRMKLDGEVAEVLVLRRNAHVDVLRLVRRDGWKVSNN